MGVKLHDTLEKFQKPGHENYMLQEEEQAFENVRQFNSNLSSRGRNGGRGMVMSKLISSFTGVELYEDVDFRVTFDSPSEDFMDRICFYNLLTDFVGVPTIHSSLSDLAASAIQVRMLILNRALINFMQKIFPKLLDARSRMREDLTTRNAQNSEGDGGDYHRKSYYNTPLFSSMFVGELNQTLRHYHKNFTEGRPGEMDRENWEMLSNHFGYYYADLDEVSDQPGSEDLYRQMREGDEFDIIMLAMLTNHIQRYEFKIRKGEGVAAFDLEELEFELMDQCFQNSIQEFLRVPLGEEQEFEDLVGLELRSFYFSFWRNYLANVVPIIGQTIFPFCSQSTIVAELTTKTFVQALIYYNEPERMLGSGVEDADITKIVNLFEYTLDWEGEVGSSLEQELVDNNEQETQLRNVSRGLREVVFLQNYSEEHVGRMMSAVKNAIMVAEDLDRAANEENQFIFSSMEMIRDREVKYLDEGFKGGNSGMIRMITGLIVKVGELEQGYIKTLLVRGLDNTIRQVVNVVGEEVLQLPPFARKIMLPLGILRYSATWFGEQGMPSPKFFFFSRFLRPVNPWWGKDGRRRTTYLSFAEMLEESEQLEEERMRKNMDPENPDPTMNIDPFYAQNENEQYLEGEGELPMEVKGRAEGYDDPHYNEEYEGVDLGGYGQDHMDGDEEPGEAEEDQLHRVFPLGKLDGSMDKTLVPAFYKNLYLDPSPK